MPHPLKRSVRRGLALSGAFVIILALWSWPARRNYYGKLEGLDVRLDVPYVAGSADPKQQLDLYLPRASAKRFPIVVFVHGGYWSPFDRRFLQPLLGTYGNVGAAFARHGVGAAIIGYRQYPQIADGDESLDDIARAIAFVQRSAEGWGADAARVYAIGHSAGGHYVSLLAMDERIFSRHGVAPLMGFVSIDGVFDLNTLLASLGPSEVEVMKKLFGPDAAALTDHSTTTHARPGHPAVMFVESAGDEPFCIESWEALRAQLNTTSSTAHFVMLDGLGHNEIMLRVGSDEDPLLPTLLEYIGP